MDDAQRRIAALPTGHLDAEIAELAAHIYAATCRWLLLVAEFERRGAHEECGFQHCASWLSWRCSVAAHTAREHVRVARALAELPLVRGAFSRGELSYSKVRALTRVAKPTNEVELVEVALHASASQLDRLVGAYRGCLDPAEERAAHARRHLAYRWEDDGTLSIRARLPAEDGALFLRALEGSREAASALPEAEGGPAEPPPENPRAASNADALVAMADAALASGQATRTGAERHQLVVHLEADRATIADGPQIASAAARRLGCDASLLAIAEREDGPLSVGRRTRTVPAAIRRALRARDGGCRFPGCDNRRFTDAHHIRHWADGGETSLRNLAELCRRHHRLVHEGGFTIDANGEGLVFRRPDGIVVPEVPASPRGRPGYVAALSERRKLRIHPETCFPRSAGDRMDLHLTVWGLCKLDEVAGPVATRAGPDW
jgi:hypothetical protein